MKQYFLLACLITFTIGATRHILDTSKTKYKKYNVVYDDQEELVERAIKQAQKNKTDVVSAYVINRGPFCISPHPDQRYKQKYLYGIYKINGNTYYIYPAQNYAKRSL